MRADVDARSLPAAQSPRRRREAEADTPVPTTARSRWKSPTITRSPSRSTPRVAGSSTGWARCIPACGQLRHPAERDRLGCGRAARPARGQPPVPLRSDSARPGNDRRLQGDAAAVQQHGHAAAVAAHRGAAPSAPPKLQRHPLHLHAVAIRPDRRALLRPQRELQPLQTRRAAAGLPRRPDLPPAQPSSSTRPEIPGAAAPRVRPRRRTAGPPARSRCYPPAPRRSSWCRRPPSASGAAPAAGRVLAGEGAPHPRAGDGLAPRSDPVGDHQRGGVVRRAPPARSTGSAKWKTGWPVTGESPSLEEPSPAGVPDPGERQPFGVGYRDRTAGPASGASTTSSGQPRRPFVVPVGRLAARRRRGR